MGNREYLGHELARTHLTLKSIIQDLLKPHGVTVQQFEVLRRVAAEEGLTASLLVHRIVSDSSTMMSILARLQSKGLITRRTDKSDRRIKRIYLTPTGRGLVLELTVIADDHNREMVSQLSAEELSTFRRVLDKLYDYGISKKGE